MRRNPVDPVRAFGRGEPVVLVDGAEPHPGAQLVVSASLVDPGTMAFVVRHTSGYVTVALPAIRCDELHLPALVALPDAHTRGVPGVAVDAAEGVTTGISAADRAYTARLLADDTSDADDFNRPGHLVPLRLSERAQRRRSSSAAALQLARLAWLPLAAVSCQLVRDDGPLLTVAEALEFGSANRLAVVTLDELSASFELVGAA